MKTLNVSIPEGLAPVTDSCVVDGAVARIDATGCILVDVEDGADEDQCVLDCFAVIFGYGRSEGFR